MLEVVDCMLSCPCEDRERIWVPARRSQSLPLTWRFFDVWRLALGSREEVHNVGLCSVRIDTANGEPDD